MTTATALATITMPAALTTTMMATTMAMATMTMTTWQL